MSSAIPSNLYSAYLNKTLIPIVGAGVSMSLRNESGSPLFPSWHEFLELAAKKLTEEDKTDFADAIKAMLSLKKYQDAANIAKEGLVGGLWNNLFHDTFDIKSELIDDHSLQLPKAIWKLSSRIITLNYDRVLRIACPQPHDVRELDNTTKSALANFNRNDLNKPLIWHLHGNLDNIERMIFTSDRYSRLYAEKDDDYKAAIKTLKSICSTTTLLFIGCSLDDAELLQQIGCEHQIFEGNTGPHYALVREEDALLIKIKLQGLPIQIVTFKNFGDPLIDKITEITHSATQKKDLAVVPTTINTEKIATDNSPANATKARIAVLCADPIGEGHNHNALLKTFATFKCEISYLPLNISSLNSLENFNYIFIVSSLIKNKIVIEDSALQSSRASFTELEENIGNKDTHGIFIFLNHQTKETIETDEINNDTKRLTLPTIILPALEKAQLDSFHYKVFKKFNLDITPNSTILNREKFILSELCGTKIHFKNHTKLPENIDPKNTKSYIGRKTDLQSICRSIVELQEVNEILTIKGPGGTGKTATIKKIVVALAEHNLFPEGICFIDCEFISDHTEFEKKIAANYNLENIINLKQQIQVNLTKQEKLIILDNVETLLHLPDTPLIKDFIYFICDYSSVIATSRELLDLDCERVIELNRFSTDEANELFLQNLNRRTLSEQEKRFIRHEIVEKMLDNNPLAIKLVAKNTPSSKNFIDLKKELEDDIFRKASSDELAEFDRISDVNIERKNSLYASINFSYNHMNEAEKLAFELLSLFPDGIHMEELKRISLDQKSAQRNSNKQNNKSAKKSPPTKHIITDLIIKALEDKSMIQVDNHTIKLQSIVGKFAEYQLNKRTPRELTRHYQNACLYNMNLCSHLHKTKDFGHPYNSTKIFNNNQSNIFKSLTYIAKSELSAEDAINYLDNITNLSIRVAANKAFSKLLTPEKIQEIKTVILPNNTEASLCLDIISISNEYFSGKFEASFTELKKVLPLQKTLEINADSKINTITILNSTSIYAMEGEAFSSVKTTIRNSIYFDTMYPGTLFCLGIFDKELLDTTRDSFYTFEARLATGTLCRKNIDEHIEKIYEKDHINLMQVSYIKFKLDMIEQKPHDIELIRKVPIVNPYTQGLKQLMLAISSKNEDEKNELYEKAINNLTHIKYYHTEGLLHFARHLKTTTTESDKFLEIHSRGLDLARKHSYNWLQYQFEDLLVKKQLPYCDTEYVLPEELNISKYTKTVARENIIKSKQFKSQNITW